MAKTFQDMLSERTSKKKNKTFNEQLAERGFATPKNIGTSIPKEFDVFDKQTPVTFNNMGQKPITKIAPAQTISTVSTGIARPTVTTLPTVTTKPTENEVLNRGDTLTSYEDTYAQLPWYKKIFADKPASVREQQYDEGKAENEKLDVPFFGDVKQAATSFVKSGARGIVNVLGNAPGGKRVRQLFNGYYPSDNQQVWEESDYDKGLREAQQLARSKMGTAEGYYTDVKQGLGSSIPAIMVGGVPGIALMGTLAGGQNAQQAMDNGASASQAGLHGLVTGTGEAVTEKMFGWIPGGKALEGELKALSGNARKNLMKVLTSTAKKTVGEGIEEVIMDPVTGLSEKYIYNPNKKWTGEGGVFDKKQMLNDFLVGMGAGILMGGPQIPGQVHEVQQAQQEIVNNFTDDVRIGLNMPQNSNSFKMAQYIGNKGLNVTIEEYDQFTNELKREIQKMNKFEQQIPQLPQLPQYRPLAMSSMQAGKKFDFKNLNNKALQELEQRNGNNVQTSSPIGENNIQTQLPIGEKLGTQNGVNEGRNVTNWDISRLERITSEPMQNTIEPTQNTINAEQTTTDNLTDAAKKYSMRVPIGGKTFTYKENTTSPHIDNRSYGNVSERKVKAYQYEHPEVKPWYQDYAKYILDNQYVRAKSGWEGDIERSIGMQGNVMKKLKDGVGSYAEIEKGLNAIIKDEGAENIAAAKRIELVIDDMLTNGFRSNSGNYSDPVKPYIKLKEVLRAKRPFVDGGIGKDINVGTKNVETEKKTETDKDLQYKISRKINSMAFEKAMSKMKYKTLDDKDINKTNKKVSKPMFMNQGEEFKYWENKYVSDFSKNKNFIENIKNEHYKEIASIGREKILNDSFNKEDWQVPQDIIIDRGSIPKNKAIESHKKAIEKAINEGKNIPDEVIKDYPELKYNEYQKEIDNVEKTDKTIEKTDKVDKLVDKITELVETIKGNNGIVNGDNKGAKVNTEESKYNNNVSKDDKSTQKPNPWPKDFPPLVIMTNLKNLRLKDNGNYDLWEKAKAGDTESAFTLVNKLLKKDKIKELGVKYPNATLVSVHAEESTGRNTLPSAYATIISELTGLNVDDGILQSNKASRTDKSKEERLFQKVMFDGEVKSGYTYIIVDDVMSQGGTVRGLREYIENNGGIVVAVTTLSPGYASPTQISITPETINRLKERFGYEEINKALKEFDVTNSIDELTEAEGRDILRKFRNVNEFRARGTSQTQARNNSRSETTNKGTGTVSFTEGLTSREGGPKIGRASGDNTTGESKKASEIFKDFSKKLGVAVRQAKVGVGRLGEFHNRTHLIKIKDANDLPVLSHEVGHYFDRLYDLSTNRSHYNELEKLGEATSRSSYSKDRVRREGVAEFVRLYLTENETAMQEAPGFYTFFEQQVPKEVVETLGDLRKEIWALVNLDPVSRVGKSISFYDDENTMDKIKKVKDVDILSGARRFYAGMVDATFPIEWAAGKIGKTAKVDISAKLAQLRGYEGIALFDLNPNLNKDFYQIDSKGSKVGDSYGIITKGIHDTKETRKDFMKYQVARRAMDYYDRDLKMPDTKETYEETIRILEEKYPMFNDTFEAIVKYRYNNSKLLVDAGIYSSKQFQEMNDANKNYVPLKRIMDAFDYVAGSGGKLGSAKKLIKSLKGSGRDIMDPEESDIGNTFMYRAASMRNKILQDLTFMFDHQINSDATDGMGWLISRASAKVQPVEFNLKQVKKYLEEAGIDTTGLDLDIMARVFVPNYLAKENQIVVYREGKPILYDVHPELYQSIKGMKFEQLEWITKPLVAIASIQRAGIIYTEKYLMNNLFRDVGHSLISSKANIKPWDIVGGLFHTMFKTQTYKQAMRYGATTNYSAVNERSFAEETIKDIYNNAKGYRKIVSKLPPHKWIRIIRDMIEPMEMGARIAEYKKYLRQTGETEENISKAVHLSRDLSVDFKRMGSWVKALQLNRLSLFFNSQVQGVDKFVRTFKDNPGRTTIRGFIYLTLPTIILMAINHDDEDYKDLPQWRKDLFWNIPLGDGLFFPIPMPYEFGVAFKVLPERLMQKYALKNEKAWRDFAETIKTTFMPELSLSALQPEIDIAMNRDWKNRPIESSSDLEVSPELRYNNYTSEFAKNIGEATGRSPKKIEYLVKGHFGTWGKTFLDATDYLSKNDKGKSIEKSYFKKFVIDAQQNSQAVDDFYENYAEVRTMNADERRLGNKPNPLQKALNSEFARVSKDMNTIRDLQTIVDKKDLENEELIKVALQKVIIDKAKKTNKLHDVAVKVMERLK